MPFVDVTRDVLDLLKAIKEIKEEEVKNADEESSETDRVKTAQGIKMSGENIGKVILREISRI